MSEDVAATPSGSSEQPNPDGLPRGARYVALGSSFAAGPGITPLASVAALRSARNYAHLVAQALQLDLVDVTCSGATTANISDVPQRCLGRTFPPQLDALTAETALVTVTAGGNDVGYIGTVGSAALRHRLAARLPLPAATAARLRREPPLEIAPDAFATARDGLVSIAARIRAVAPQARVVFVDYLTLVGPDTRPESSGVPFDAGELDQIRHNATSLAKTFADAAHRAGVELVAASAASTAHGIGSTEPWTRALSFGIPWLGGRVPFHPNAGGMAAVARLVLAHLRTTPATPTTSAPTP